MTNFAAIDFETANSSRSSVCSVGVVVVRGGEIVDSFYSLIRPRPNYYSRFTTSIHGLTYEDTADAPDFVEVWQQVAPRIAGLPLVAHNAPFDEGCLKSVFELYGLPYPGYTFYCTCRAARRVFGRTLPNHQLHTVSAACGYNLEQHHHALADGLRLYRTKDSAVERGKWSFIAPFQKSNYIHQCTAGCKPPTIREHRQKPLP